MESGRPKAKSFRDLLVWRKAHEFVIGVYRYTSEFPRQETYALALQMRRAAVSIPANIAEGFTRRSKTDKARFMNIAESSLEESRYYLILAQDLGYGPTDALTNSLEDVSRPLNAYSKSHSGFWLLTSGFSYPAAFWRDIKGRSPLASTAVRNYGNVIVVRRLEFGDFAAAAASCRDTRRKQACALQRRALGVR